MLKGEIEHLTSGPAKMVLESNSTAAAKSNDKYINRVSKSLIYPVHSSGTIRTLNVAAEAYIKSIKWLILSSK